MGDTSKYYNILDIDKSATDEEIKKSYRKAAVKWHPDKWANRTDEEKKNAEEKFKEVGTAYEVLSNPEKKNIYDRFGEEGLKGNNGMGGGDPFDIFERFFGGGGGMGGMGGMPFGGMPFGWMPFGGGGMRSSGKKDSKISLTLKYSEIMNGGTRRIKHKRKIIENKNNISKCEKCDGKGQRVNITQIGPGMISQSIQTCQYCQGLGKKINYKIIEENLEIPIEKGTKKGEYIKLSNKGDEMPDNITGDLIIIFDEESSSTLQKQGNNLVYLKKILLSEALGDLEFLFEHPNGNNIIIKSENVIKPDSVKIIKSLGFPIKNSIRSGDLIIKFHVVFPEYICEKKQELINKLLPKRNKLKESDKDNINVYHLEDFSNNSNNYDSDDDMRNMDGEGVQCAQ